MDGLSRAGRLPDVRRRDALDHTRKERNRRAARAGMVRDTARVVPAAEQLRRYAAGACGRSCALSTRTAAWSGLRRILVGRLRPRTSSTLRFTTARARTHGSGKPTGRQQTLRPRDGRARLQSIPKPVKIVAQDFPPIRVERTLQAEVADGAEAAASMFTTSGRTSPGWSGCALQGPAGTDVRLRFAEVLNADGTHLHGQSAHREGDGHSF